MNRGRDELVSPAALSVRPAQQGGGAIPSPASLGVGQEPESLGGDG